MTTPFATPSDLTTYLSGDQTYFLAAATAEIQRYCGWQIYPQVTETISIDGSGNYIQPLPSLMVADITAVSNDGEALDITTITWSKNGWMSRSPVFGSSVASDAEMTNAFGDLILRYWTNKPQAVTLTWTHGYTTLPADVKNIALEMAARACALPFSVTSSETAGPYSRTIPTDKDDGEVFAGIYLTDREKSSLSSYKLWGVA